MAEPVIRIENAHKQLGGTAILKGLNLSLYSGTVAAILGPSGAGKSTLLRAIAGLDRLDNGSIHHRDSQWDGSERFVPANTRRVGVVFQDYALFPHLTVEKNIGFGLKGLLSEDERRERINSLMGAAELSQLSRSYPHELSGGEQQRVALARALAPRPDIVLLDEPFSSLDRRLRTDLRAQTIEAIKAEGAAALLVTHDSEEAFETADQLLLMENGQIVQSGDPAEVYNHPVNLTCARLLGDINAIPVQAAGGKIETALGTYPAGSFHKSGSGMLLVRPEAVIENPGGVVCMVEDIRIRHGRRRLRVKSVDGTVWLMDAPLTHNIKKGEDIALTLDPDALTILPDQAA